MDKRDAMSAVLFGTTTNEIKDFDLVGKCSNVIQAFIKLQTNASSEIKDKWIKSARNDIKSINNYIDHHDLKKIIISISDSWEKIYKTSLREYKHDESIRSSNTILRIHSIPSKCPWGFKDLFIEDSWDDGRIEHEIQRLSKKIISNRYK